MLVLFFQFSLTLKLRPSLEQDIGYMQKPRRSLPEL